MTRLDAPTYLSSLRRESARFADVLRDCDPAARVPACPDWDAGDLLWHLAEVQWFWSQVVAHRPAGPADDAARPDRADGWEAQLDQYAELSAGLLDALTGADADEPAWSWAEHVPDGQTVGFTLRRQAHEALVHRLDAEQTAGPDAVTSLDPALAADGVAELLEVMYGGEAPWGTVDLGPRHVRVDLTDVGVSLWVRPGTISGTHPSGKVIDGPHLLVVEDPGTPADAVVAAPAAVLDAAWWQRTDGSGVEVTGDPAAYDALLAATSAPLD